jgi:hypothetical protein
MLVRAGALSVCLLDSNLLDGAAFTEVVLALGHHWVTFTLSPQLPAGKHLQALLSKHTNDSSTNRLQYSDSSYIALS